MTDPTVDMPACKECGAPLARKKTGPAPTYCSPLCRTRAGLRRAKANGRYAAQLQLKREATAAHRSAAKPIPCVQCGVEFQPPTLRSKLCSKKCRRVYEKATARRCGHYGCSKPVRAKDLCIGHYNQTYSPDRHKRWPEARDKKAKRDLVKAKRRRAASRGVESENVDRQRVGERDQWRCHICKRKVDKDLAYPDPKSQSLDHIVPLAEGGAHTYANTRIAHLECNNLRRDRGGNEQLALIG